MLTQVAPLDVLTSALSSGQSAIASLPSSHRLGLAVRRGDRTRVEVVATDDDRRRHLTRADHLVEAQPETMTLAIPEPADPRRKTLERDPLAGHLDPAVQVVVVGELVEHGRDPSRRCRRDRPTTPPSGTGPCPRRTTGGCTRAGIPDSRRRGRTRRAAPRCASCCRSRRPHCPCRESRPLPGSASAMLSLARRINSCGLVRASSAVASGVRSAGT